MLVFFLEKRREASDRMDVSDTSSDTETLLVPGRDWLIGMMLLFFSFLFFTSKRLVSVIYAMYRKICAE